MTRRQTFQSTFFFCACGLHNTYNCTKKHIQTYHDFHETCLPHSLLRSIPCTVNVDFLHQIGTSVVLPVAPDSCEQIISICYDVDCYRYPYLSFCINPYIYIYTQYYTWVCMRIYDMLWICIIYWPTWVCMKRLYSKIQSLIIARHVPYWNGQCRVCFGFLDTKLSSY